MLGRECPSLLALLSLHQVHQPLRVSLSALFQLKLSANLKLSAQHLFNEDRIYSLLFSFSLDPFPIWKEEAGSPGGRAGENCREAGEGQYFGEILSSRSFRLRLCARVRLLSQFIIACII